MPQSDRELIDQICKIVKKEMLQWRESMTYYDIEAYTGSLLAAFLEGKIITKWEESIIRERVLGK